MVRHYVLWVRRALAVRTSLARTRMSANFGNIGSVRNGIIALILGFAPLAPAIAETLLLRPARVFDGVNPAPHEGWSVLVEGDRIAAAGPNLAAPAGARVDRPSRRDPDARDDRGPFAPLPPPLQRDLVGRSGAARAARAAHRPRRGPRRADARSRLHDRARPRHRGRGLRRRRAQAGDRPGHRPRPSPARRDQGDRRARRLRPQGLRAGRRRSRRARRKSPGVDETIRAVRDQIAGGADIVKFYADYHWGKGEPTRVTLSQAELDAGVAAAHDAGRQVAVHATHRRGHDARRPRRRRHDRARLWRHRRGVPG